MTCRFLRARILQELLVLPPHLLLRLWQGHKSHSTPRNYLPSLLFNLRSPCSPWSCRKGSLRCPATSCSMSSLELQNRQQVFLLPYRSGWKRRTRAMGKVVSLTLFVALLTIITNFPCSQTPYSTFTAPYTHSISYISNRPP